VTVLDEIAFTIAVEKNRIIEERLRVILRPRPSWLPEFIWRRILARLLYLEHS
jgi:hypothetical protein